MFQSQDPFSTAALTNLQAQIVRMNGLAAAGLAGMEKLIELNLTVMRTSMQESSVIAQQLMKAQAPQEFVSLLSQLARPTTEKAVAYSRHLATIASGTQAEFARSTEEQLAEASATITKLVDDASRTAPPGTENLMAIVKSGIGTASASYEQMNKSARQMRDAMEANLNVAAGQVVSNVERAATKAANGAAAATPSTAA
jgi:phasin family protein